jgi:orotate phosphoribosyltransferase
MDKTSLYHDLLDNGLVQFGMFGAEEAPYLIQIGLLPSYPAILKALANGMGAFIPSKIERLLTVASAYGVGLALSLASDVPMVYSLGTSGIGVADIIGAYDVGHPTVLIVDVWRGEDAILPLIQKAEGVGLSIEGVICCFSVGQPEMKTSTLSVQTWVDVADMVEVLIEDEALSPAMRDLLNQ